MTFCEMYIKLFYKTNKYFSQPFTYEMVYRQKKGVKGDTFSIFYDILIIKNLVYIFKHLLIINITI